MKKLVLMPLVSLVLLGLTALEVDPQFLAADQSLLTLPTAYTMPKGLSAITDFEVLLLQYSYALTGRIHISAGMAFPVVKEMVKTFTFGTKINYLKHKNMQTALWASYTPDPQTSTLGNILSIGNTSASLHLITAFTLDFKRGNQEFIAGLGGVKTISARLSAIAEYYYSPHALSFNTEEADPGDDDELKQVFLIGIRFKGHKMSWDLGGVRPLGIDTEDVLALPFVKATFMF